MKRLALLLCVAACSEDTQDKPRPPDMSALVDGYANPTRDFDAATANEIQATVEAKVKALADLDKLSSMLDDALASINEPDQLAGIKLEGEGYARIERICSGHGTPAPPVDKAANGYLDLTVGYSDKGLDPVVFGGAFDCREQAAGAQLTIAGDVHLFVGDNVRVDATATTPILFELANFGFDVDGTNIVSGGFDFQVCRGSATQCVPDHLETLFGVPSGGTLVLFFNLATKRGGFRAKNGVWTCDFAAGTCSDGATTITIPVYSL